MTPLEHFKRAEELLAEVEEFEEDQEGDLDSYAQRHCERALAKAAVHAQLAAIAPVQSPPRIRVEAAQADAERIAEAVRRNNPGNVV